MMVASNWDDRLWAALQGFPKSHGAVKRVGILLLSMTAVLILLSGYRTVYHIRLNEDDSNGQVGYQNSAPLSLQWDSACMANVSYLRNLQSRLDFTSPIQYGERYIQYKMASTSRPSVTKVDQALFPNGFQTLDMDSNPELADCLTPLKVVLPESPVPGTVNASEILFGISTTMSRLRDLVTIKEWSFWLTDGNGASNGAGLVVLLVEASDTEAEELQALLNDIGIHAEVQLADSTVEMAVRYLSMVPKLHASDLNVGRKWLALCDDDTFFPSMHGLLAELDEQDDTAPLYVGTLSEDIHSVERHGSQAFGGAGVFLSMPLASTVSSLYDSCSTPDAIAAANSGWGPQGDIILRRCIYENTQIRLSTIAGLWQMDLTGDASGFYERGDKPLSLHHFKGGQWHTAVPFEMVKLSRVLGEDSFLMRFQTIDNFIISTGYSVAQYPKGIEFPISQVERTFGAVGDDKGYNFDFTFGPQRMSLSGTGKKTGWHLKETVLEKGGIVRQVYFKSKGDARWRKEGEEEGKEDGEEVNQDDLDGIIVLIFIPG